MSSIHRSKNYVPSEQQPQANNNMMPNFPPNQSHNTFFSPQNAFYGTPNQTSTNTEFLSNNPLLHVGFNAVEKSVKDITSNTMNRLPDEMKKSLSSIKYYFDVDQTYVANKICLLLFPFRPRNWSLEYSDDKPIPPRADTNAPDYYIPLMSAMTYVLVAGLVLGTQNRFTPEQLGIHASSALVWNIIEICILCFTFYIFNVRSKLRTLDLTAYCGYKYVGMIATLSLYLMTYSLFVYWITLLYVSISLSYFLLKSLRLQILADVGGSQAHNPHGNTRRIYLLLSIAFLQPFFIWYFTRHLIVS